MSGIIISLPPSVELPPGNASGSTDVLPPVTYQYAILALIQTWTALQNFSAGATGVTQVPGDSSINLATTAFVTSAVALSLIPIDQHITAGPIAISNNTGTARVDQTVGTPITLNLPLAASKTCPVLICDWKGDAGTNNITINPSGSETIQGRSSWTIAADNGSVFLRPISGVGYAL